MVASNCSRASLRFLESGLIPRGGHIVIVNFLRLTLARPFERFFTEWIQSALNPLRLFENAFVSATQRTFSGQPVSSSQRLPPHSWICSRASASAGAPILELLLHHDRLPRSHFLSREITPCDFFCCWRWVSLSQGARLRLSFALGTWLIVMDWALNATRMPTAIAFSQKNVIARLSLRELPQERGINSDFC